MESFLILADIYALIYLFDFLIEGVILSFMWKKFIKNSLSLSLKVNLVSISILTIFTALICFHPNWIFHNFNNLLPIIITAELIAIKIFIILVKITLYPKTVKNNPEKFFIKEMDKKNLISAVLIANIFSFSNLFLLLLYKVIMERSIVPT